jgi:hypothetical protein
MVRILYSALLLPLALCASTFLAQQAQPDDDHPRYGFRPDMQIESRQGHPGKPDVIAHKHVSKGVRVKCIQVEHYPKQVDDGAACVVKFEDGSKQALTFGQVTKAPSDGEMYLECLGDRPTRCTVGVW